MMSRNARRFLPACILSAAFAAVLAVPGAASAAIPSCKGEAIHGKGSSAQKILQISVWNVDFNKLANPAACDEPFEEGANPKVTYTSTGSGPGIESWGVETKAGGEIRFGHENAFVGTEIAPNKKQSEEIVSHGEPGTLLTIPVAQPAITIPIQLPKGCEKVEGGPVPGRIAFTDAVLEKVFQGTDTKWSQILNKAKLVGNSECKATSDLITRVVREDGSGTTASYMKWLGVFSTGKVSEGKTWKELAEVANNTIWPNEALHPVARGNGGGGVVKKVTETPGGIGYANLADARANADFVPPTGGSGKPFFWAEVENSAGSYSEPSTNGEVAEKQNSNCGETKYTNGKKKFPPPTAKELWNEVTTAKVQTTYEICYLTYDLSLTKYHGFTKGTTVVEPPTEKEVETTSQYFKYELNTEANGGQKVAEGQDYLGLPAEVLAISVKGQGEIGF